MKKYIYTLLTAVLITAASILPAKAYADCEPIYGGGQTCTSNSFTIQKFVQTPGKGGGAYVNNLSINDPQFSPSQFVNFEIVVQNTGTQNIPALTVVDSFPQYVSFVSGPGSFNSNNDTLTFTVNNLNGGQSVNFFVTVKIYDANSLPTNQGVTCLINQASATDNNGVTSNSSSQFCVSQPVLAASVPQVYTAPEVVTTPPTGPEMLPLALLLPGGLGGLMLRRKSNKNTFLRGVKNNGK